MAREIDRSGQEGAQGFVTKGRLNAKLHGLDNPLLRRARAIPFLPEAALCALNRLGRTDLPTVDVPFVSGELVTSRDQTVIGFTPPGSSEEALCGVAITPGSQDAISSVRSRFILSEDADLPVAFVPEGPYQIVLTAPRPFFDKENEDLVFYTGSVLVNADIDAEGTKVTGTPSSFVRNGNPVNWMILNQRLEPGEEPYAVRHVPGIVFPTVGAEKESLTLAFNSLTGESDAALSEDTFRSNGVVAVSFIEHRMPATEAKIGKKRRILEEARARLVAWNSPAIEPSPMFQMRALPQGTTAYTETMSPALVADKSGEAERIGPTVYFVVTSDPVFETTPAGFPDARVLELRDPGDTHPALQAMARWQVPYAKGLLPAHLK